MIRHRIPDSRNACTKFSPVIWSKLQTPDGTDSIVVSTGGPLLLILEFTDARLVSARWLGQR